MSLTSLILHNTKVKAVLKEISPSKTSFFTNSGLPAFSKDARMMVPYNLGSKMDAILVGIAADYLFRFVVARTINVGKESVLRDLVAEDGLALLPKAINKTQLQTLVNEGRQLVRRYIWGELVDEKLLAIFVFHLSYLELYRRSGQLPDRIEDIIERNDTTVINELLELTKVFKQTFIDSGLVRHDSDVVFNPHFGKWGALCGGADADIYIDGTLYDFKCTQKVYSDWTEIGQVYGYYCLFQLCREDTDKDVAWIEKSLEAIAIYKGRYGLINKCIISKSDADCSPSAFSQLRTAIMEEREKSDEKMSEALSRFSKILDEKPFPTTVLKKRNVPLGPFEKLKDRQIYAGPILGMGTIKGFYQEKDGAHIVIKVENGKECQDRLIDFLKWDFRLIIGKEEVDPGKNIVVIGKGYGRIINVENHKSYTEMQIELANKQVISINPDIEEWYRVAKMYPVFESDKDFPYKIGEKALWKDHAEVYIADFEKKDNKWFVLLEDANKEMHSVPLGFAALNLSEEKPRDDIEFIAVRSGKRANIDEMQIGESVKFINSAIPGKVKKQEGVVVNKSKSTNGRMITTIHFSDEGEKKFLGKKI